MAEPRYPFVHVDVPSDRADVVSGQLFELGASGVEERDDATLSKGPGVGRVRLVASFASRDDAEAAREDLASAEDLAPWIEDVVGDAWRDAWKEHFEPFALTPTITIRPPWRPYEARGPDERVLELEPGRAFGTGLHATTSLIAGMLHDAGVDALAGRRVLDAGTGSGILALAALVYGAEHVDAFDNDPDVIDVVRENAERNGFEGKLTAWAGDIAQVTETYPWVLANIETRTLRSMRPHLTRVLAAGGRLLLSGILEKEHEELIDAFTASSDLEHEETRRGTDPDGSLGTGDETWVAIQLRRR